MHPDCIRKFNCKLNFSYAAIKHGDRPWNKPKWCFLALKEENNHISFARQFFSPSQTHILSRVTTKNSVCLIFLISWFPVNYIFWILTSPLHRHSKWRLHFCHHVISAVLPGALPLQYFDGRRTYNLLWLWIKLCQGFKISLRNMIKKCKYPSSRVEWFFSK